MFTMLKPYVSALGNWDEMSSFVGAVLRGSFFLWQLTAGRTTGISHDYSNSNDNNNRICCEEPCHLMTDSNVCLELPPADTHINIVPDS